MLDECTQGTGALLEKVDGKLTADLCKEIARVARTPTRRGAYGGGIAYRNQDRP